MRPRYVLRPLPDGTYQLTGPRLPYPLRYESCSAAASFAHWQAEDTGGVLIVLDSTGYAQFSETIGKEERDWYPRPVAVGGFRKIE